MSRISDSSVWQGTFKNNQQAQCPVCFTKTLDRNHRNGGGWKSIPYIAFNQGGKDVMANLTPSCLNCHHNLRGKGLYAFQYSCGMMTENQLNELQTRKKNEMRSVHFSQSTIFGQNTNFSSERNHFSSPPPITRCIYYLSNNKYCRRTTIDKINGYCQSHVNVDHMPMEIDRNWPTNNMFRM